MINIIERTHWNKVGLWFLAFFVQAQLLYPGLDGEMIVASIKDGTFWIGFINILIAFIATRAAVTIKRSE